MALRWSLLALIAAIFALLPGCKTRPRVQTVTVRIFRDPGSPYASELDRRILDFQVTNPRLPDGAAVLVGNLSDAELLSAMNHLDDPGVDIVILDSPADALKYPSLQPEMPRAVNVCGALGACPAEVPALVPSKVQGDRADAANKFVQYLATKTMPPPAAAPAPTPEAAPTAPPDKSASPPK